METNTTNIFLTRKLKLTCNQCGHKISLGKAYVAESEDSSGTCLSCSPFVAYTLLPPGNVALTHRSKKNSANCGVVYAWNQRQKRYDRKGQYVEAEAIRTAKIECANDEEIRAKKNEKAAIVREAKDKEYIQAFAKAIRNYYPNCPPNREFEIAHHACEKYSGRVGRTAYAKIFDIKMIDLAVEAHIRHTETNYDTQFGKGKRKKEIRYEVKDSVKWIMSSWK